MLRTQLSSLPSQSYTHRKHNIPPFIRPLSLCLSLNIDRDGKDLVDFKRGGVGRGSAGR